MASEKSPTRLPVTFSVALNGRNFFAALVGLLCLVLIFSCSRKGDAYIPKERVWAEIKRQAPKHGLDPAFVLNIAYAESTLNAHADTGYARGMMQLSYAAWSDRTVRSWEHAYNWRINLEVGMRHLEYLKSRLELKKRYDSARLAAAYHRGLTALIQKKYRVEDLPVTANEIYKQLFAGRVIPPSAFGL